MRIFTFNADAPDSPDKVMARIHNEGGWHPVIFTGPTREEARKRAHDWWNEEVAKAQAKENRPKRGAVQPAAPTPPCDACGKPGAWVGDLALCAEHATPALADDEDVV